MALWPLSVDKASSLMDKIKLELARDPLSLALKEAVEGNKWQRDLPLWSQRQFVSLSDDGGVVLVRGRALVPEVLVPEVLQAVHRGHLGIEPMLVKARESFWWPNMSRDMRGVQEKCRSCNERAPSKSSPPWADLEPDELPSRPFQCVSSDFFHIAKAAEIKG